MVFIFVGFIDWRLKGELGVFWGGLSEFIGVGVKDEEDTEREEGVWFSGRKKY